MKPEGYDEGDVLSDGDLGEYENGRNATGRYTATGNEADIEDNVLPPFTAMPILLSEKLRQKPPECAPTTPCRLASAREEFIKNIALRPLSTAERLTCRPKSAIEAITDTIEKPEGAVPPLALPNWHSLPLDKKIPGGIRAPAGLLYYSPGKLSVQLNRHFKRYKLTDPYNRERVVGTPYSALNDPHAKDFINRPGTKQLLYNQGLINQNEEVIYTLREFNKYRDYLRTMYSDDVHEILNEADELWKMEQAQLKSIRQDEKEGEWSRKLNKKRISAQEKRDYTIARHFHRQQQTEVKLVAWAKLKEQANMERLSRSSEKSRLQKEKLQLLLKQREATVIQTYQQTVMKNLHCMERRKENAHSVKTVHENYLFEWLETKINHSKESIDKYNRIRTSCRENLRRKAAIRQRRAEIHRKNIPKYIEKNRQKFAYQWKLAEKYFYIWLKKVRQNAAQRADTDHESCWIKAISGTLAHTVTYLRTVTNTHERLDDFIVNIISLKKEIRRQLELEEAAEQTQKELRVEEEKVEQKFKPDEHQNE